MKRRQSHEIGFSLAEIVIALGVMAFGLVAIIGVIPIGLSSGRSAVQDTRANHLAEQIFATLQVQPFTAASLATLGNSSSTVDLSTEDTASGAAGVILHANYDGQFVTANDYFTIELRFRKAPDGVVAGHANEVHLKISGRETNAPPSDYSTIIAAH